MSSAGHSDPQGRLQGNELRKYNLVRVILVGKKKIRLQSWICRRVDEISLRHSKDVERSSRAYRMLLLRRLWVSY